MNKQEFATLAMALRTYYPDKNLLPNDKAMELWFAQLADINYKTAETALNKWVSLSKWPPSIADLREAAFDIEHGEQAQWGDAWEEVLTALRQYGSWDVKGALESMSPLTRRVTERIGFINLCMSENPAADRANFRMIYEQYAEREKREKQIPEPLRHMIGQIKGNLIEGGTHEENNG